MGCEETRDLLPLYIGGDLPATVAGPLEAHLNGCSACARERDLYRECQAALTTLRSEEHGSEEDWKRMSASVRSELFPARPSRTLHYFDEALRYAAVLMVGLAIGVAAYLLQKRPVATAGDSRPQADFVGVRRLSGAQPVHSGVFGVPRPVPVEKPALRTPGPEAGFYLPKVESLPVGGEKDF